MIKNNFIKKKKNIINIIIFYLYNKLLFKYNNNNI